jgi:hypothetical protein
MHTEVMHLMLKRAGGWALAKRWALAGVILLGGVGPAVGRPPMVRMGMGNGSVGPAMPRPTMVAPSMMPGMTNPGMMSPGMMTPGMTRPGTPIHGMTRPSSIDAVPLPAGTPVMQTSSTTSISLNSTNPFRSSTNTLSPTAQFLLLEQAALNATFNPNMTVTPFAGMSPLLPPGLTSLLPTGLNMGFFPTPMMFPSPVFNPLLLSAQLNGLTGIGFVPGFGFVPTTIATPLLFRPTTPLFFSPSLMFLAGSGLNTLPLVGLGSLTVGGMTTPATLPFVIALNGDLALTPQEEREMLRRIRLVKSQTGAASTTIWSASDLNTLLDDLKAHPNRAGQDLSLSKDVLAHINIVPSLSNANAGLLKNGRRWPELLQSSVFQAERDRIEALIPELVRQVKAGSIKRADVEELEQTVNALRDRLAGVIRDVPAPHYIRAKRFLADVQNGIKVLREPDAANYFNPLYTPKAKTVGELVRYMARRDLRFAPAATGDEAAYLVFYRALASYDVSSNMQAASGMSLVARQNDE